MKEARLYRKLTGSEVECLACSHHCRIKEDRTGICGVRKNIKGGLYLLVYGKAAAVNIDPIEKKPLYHFLPGSRSFSFGTIGCNFACQFCQNWDLSQATRLIKEQHSDPKQQMVKLGEVSDYGQRLSPETIVEYCQKQQLPIIAYTYNEPAIYFEYIHDTAKLAHAEGIKNIFVSNGYESREAVEMIRPFLDGINIDLKSFSNAFYTRRCQAKLYPVLESIKRIFKLGIWLEITTLVIPGENDSVEELTQIAEFISGIGRKIPWHLSAFHPDYRMLDKNPTPVSSLEKACQIGRKAGLKYVYTGNLPGGKESTHCPACGETLIERKYYQVRILNFKNGACPKCGEEIEGVWG
jgi:pyruvate formate lyase activating enzyme